MAVDPETREVLARLDERSEHQMRFNVRMEAWMLKHEEQNEEDLAEVRRDIDSLRLWKSRVVGGMAALGALWTVALAWIKGLFSSTPAP